MNLEYIITNVIENFNFSYMISVNTLTYLVINLIDYINGEGVVTFWQKRVILILATIIMSCVYYLSDDVAFHVLVNSSIAAPVFWSWICKPILAKTSFDYKAIDDCLK